MKKLIALLLALVLTFALAACGTTATTPATAENTAEPAAETNTAEDEAVAAYPERDVLLVVPFNPGGDTDTTARGLATPLTNYFGETIATTNITGTMGFVATSHVYNSAPDGYTLLWQNSDMMINSLLDRLEDDWDKMFKLVALACDGETCCWVVREDAPYKTMEELVAYAKEHPGEVSIGMEHGSFEHILCLEIAEQLGVEFSYVAAGGGSARVASLNSGEIDINVGAYGANAEFIKAGKFRPLCIMASEQHEDINADCGIEIPTLVEETGVDISFYKMFLCFAPIDTPDGIVEKMGEAIAKCVDSDDFRAANAKYFYTPHAMYGEEAYEYVMDKQNNYYAPLIEKWGSVAVG